MQQEEAIYTYYLAEFSHSPRVSKLGFMIHDLRYVLVFFLTIGSHFKVTQQVLMF